MMNKAVSIFFALSAQLALAAPFQDFPGTIPLQYERQAASDLMYNGKKLQPDEVRTLYDSGKVKDLSTLDPEESDIWKNEMPAQLPTNLDEMGLRSDYEELNFDKSKKVAIGHFGFVATKTSADGRVKTYSVLLSLKGHNVLLRKQLLRKLGYQIAPTMRVAKVRVKFPGAATKHDFVKELSSKVYPAEDPERWITEGKDTDNTDLVLQDALVFEGSEDIIYNVARGVLGGEDILGRRVLNSLLVAFNITDVPESVNIFGWYPGREFNNQLLLTYEKAEVFTTSFEDARWITRRLLKLSRQDWEDVVRVGQYPDDVSKLLVEKLISRRNFLREKLKFGKEFADISFDPQVSYGPNLIKGKLSGVTWDGYAAHFSSVDPDSPLSSSELGALLKSKLVTNVISNLMSEFNNRFIPSTDIGWKVLDHQLDLAAHQLTDYILTGETKKTPFGFWSTSAYGGNLIASREVVAGNYLGSENIVQLADTVGYAIDAGAYIGADGLPAKTGFSGSAKAFLVRTYTHLKPITSIKTSLKEPLSNIMVPWLKDQDANPFDKLLELEGKKEALGEKEYNAQVKACLDEFNKLLKKGESIIVQTSIGANLLLRPSYSFAEAVTAYLDLQDKLTSVTRLHIYKKDDNTIQVYRDPALYNILSIALGLDVHKVQVLEIGWSWLKGAAKTEFFSVDLRSDADGNADIFKNARAVRRVLRDNQVDVLRKVQTPWLIDHDFSEKDFKFKFLFFRYASTNITDELDVTSPSGQVKHYIRRVIGKRSGKDYESLMLDILDSLVDEYVDDKNQVNLSSTSNGNPGDTFKGKSVSHQTVLEGEVNANTLETDDLYLAVDYRWKGWDIKKEKAQGILNEISNKYGTQLFPPHTLQDTKKIQFYSIDINMSLYQDAIVTLTSLSEAQIDSLYNRYAVMLGRDAKFLAAHKQMFKGHLGNIKEAKKKGNAKKLADGLAKLVNHAESTLKFPGLVEAVGGINNLFLRGTLHGFKVGSENGDKDVFSDTLGQIGSNKPSGPLHTLQAQLGFSEGEMLVSWLLNRL